MSAKELQRLLKRAQQAPAFQQQLFAAPLAVLGDYDLTDDEKLQVVAPNFGWLIEGRLAGVSRPRSEDALERYGFSDYQQWGDMFGGPLQGEQLDGAATFETVDWLEHKTPNLDQPWLLICSLINPHDIMFLQTDPVETPHPNGSMAGLQTTAQRLGWFQEKWNVGLPDNFEDDLTLQPDGVKHYKELFDLNYGRIPEDRPELWLERRNCTLKLHSGSSEPKSIKGRNG